MKTVGFIGAYDKTELILYVGKLLQLIGKKILVIDTTAMQKTRYIVPTISPTVSYITDHEEMDIAVGFTEIDDIAKYLGKTNASELEYDYIFVDIDNMDIAEKFNISQMNKIYFVTSFDTYSIKKGLEIISNIKEPLNITKVLYAKDVLKEEDDYLNHLSLGFKVIWNEYRIYFPLEKGDQSAMIENQRVEKIKFGNLSQQYRESLLFVVEEIVEDNRIAKDVKRELKRIEKGEY